MTMDGMALVTPATLSPASVQQDAPAEGDAGAFSAVLGAVADQAGQGKATTSQGNAKVSGQGPDGCNVAATLQQPDVASLAIAQSVSPLLAALGLAADSGADGSDAPVARPAICPDPAEISTDKTTGTDPASLLALVAGLVPAASPPPATAPTMTGQTLDGQTLDGQTVTDETMSGRMPGVTGGVAVVVGAMANPAGGVAVALDPGLAEKTAVGPAVGMPSVPGTNHAPKATGPRAGLRDVRAAGGHADAPAAAFDTASKASSKPWAAVAPAHDGGFAALAAAVAERAPPRDAIGTDIATPHHAHGQSGVPDGVALPGTPVDASTSVSAAADIAAPRATAPAPVRQVAQIAVTVAARGTDESTISVALDPEELGRVEISIERQGPTAQVRVLAERPETLTILQRDQRELDRLLGQAGIGEEGRTLSFGLSSDGGGGNAADGQSRQHGGGGGPAIRFAIPERTPETRSVLGLLDIAI